MIDLTSYGNPDACAAAADRVGALAGAVGEAAQVVDAVVSRSASAWSGPAGDAFRDSCTRLGADLDESAARLHRASAALGVFAERLHDVRARLDEAREVAVAAGVMVVGNLVLPATGSAAAGGYRRAAAIADAARRAEQAAHKALLAEMSAVSAPGATERVLEALGFWPTGADPVEVTAWAENVVLTSTGVGSSVMTHVMLGEWLPQVGKHTADKADTLVKVGRAAERGSWKALEGTAATRDLFGKLGVASTIGSGAVTGALAGWEQWKADADDPEMDTAEQVGRAGAMAALTGAGAFGGAEVGATTGATIGTFILPGAGTVVGGAVGGVIGGVVGSKLGHEAGERARDLVGTVADELSGWD